MPRKKRQQAPPKSQIDELTVIAVCSGETDWCAPAPKAEHNQAMPQGVESTQESAIAVEVPLSPNDSTQPAIVATSGMKMPLGDMKKIAEMTGISVTSIAKVLADSTACRPYIASAVISAINELGLKPELRATYSQEVDDGGAWCNLVLSPTELLQVHIKTGIAVDGIQKALRDSTKYKPYKIAAIASAMKELGIKPKKSRRAPSSPSK